MLALLLYLVEHASSPLAVAADAPGTSQHIERSTGWSQLCQQNNIFSLDASYLWGNFCCHTARSTAVMVMPLVFTTVHHRL